LITGVTGLIGRQLARKLYKSGKDVVGLSRNTDIQAKVPIYKWNIEKGTIDNRALEGVETIVHLAGAPIADKRWTAKRKKTIYNSRIESTRLLANTIINNELPVKNFISASAIGIYGNRGNEWLQEDSSPEKNWLANVCKDWEAAVDPLTEWGLRTACVRIGIVLSEKGGALRKILPPIQKGINPILGNGKQYYSWIHLNDVVGIFEKIINNDRLSGTFNAVAPNPVTFKTLVTTIENTIDKKTLKTFAPKPLLWLAMGNMVHLVTDSAKVSANTIVDKGYAFQFPLLESALKDLLIN